MKTIIIEDRREKLLAYIPTADREFFYELLGVGWGDDDEKRAEEIIKKASPEKINALYFKWIEPGTITVGGTLQPTKEYILLSDKTDCGDLSIYKFFAENDEEAAEILNKAVIDSANRSDGTIQVEFQGLEGYILYKDEEKEFFRVIAGKDVPGIETHSMFSGE